MYLRLKKEYRDRETSKIRVENEFREITSAPMKEVKFVIDTIFEKGYIPLYWISYFNLNPPTRYALNSSKFLEVVKDVKDVNEDNSLYQLKDLVCKCLDNNESGLAEDLLNVYNSYKHRR